MCQPHSPATGRMGTGGLCSVTVRRGRAGQVGSGRGWVGGWGGKGGAVRRWTRTTGATPSGATTAAPDPARGPAALIRRARIRPRPPPPSPAAQAACGTVLRLPPWFGGSGSVLLPTQWAEPPTGAPSPRLGCSLSRQRPGRRCSRHSSGPPRGGPPRPVGTTLRAT